MFRTKPYKFVLTVEYLTDEVITKTYEGSLMECKRKAMDFVHNEGDHVSYWSFKREDT